jgi:steroid delta-isomerase-like uncharacterized protein
MSEQDNVNAVRGTFEAINGRDQKGYDQLHTANFTSEQPGAPGPLNPEQNWAFLQVFITAFPDLRFEVTRTIAQGDDVVAHWTATGTHTGPLVTPTGDTVPATGKKAAVVGSTTYQFKGGKIAREWVFWDMTSLLGQLGLMPS